MATRLSQSVSSTVSSSATAVSRLGLAALLGSALVAAGQLPGGDTRTTAAPAAAAGSTAGTPTTGTAAAAAVVAMPASAPVASTTMSAAARRAKAIKIAKKYVGVRYRYGGTTPRGFDCSGYTRYVWKKAGKTLPRTSRAQYRAVKKISRTAARPGDLVFFTSSSGRVFHVGIYAGKGKMYDAPRPGKRVGLRKIWSSRVSFGRVR